MPTIRDLSTESFNRGRGRYAGWRDDLLPANFDGYPFHVEAGAWESGRRIALHEFPKKELPYAEDMGRIAISFTVRGYIIVYPHEDSTTPRAPNGIETLYQKDYRNARDQLCERLERGGPGVLQLPTFVRNIPGPLIVVCTKFRLTEEDRTGGYCVFDMSFVERGKRPFAETPDSQDQLFSKTYALRKQVQSVWDAETAKGQKQIMGMFNPLVRTGQKQIMGPYNPLQRFIGPPRKMGPIKPATKSPPSEFLRTGERGKASKPMSMWQTGSA